MQIIRQKLGSPAEHLACDDAVLQAADAGQVPSTLRLWEFDQTVVIIGRSSRVDFEVNREYCAQQSTPVLRRCSGGASVVGGAGCLMYSVVLDQDLGGGLRKIDVAHQYVMSRVLAAVQTQLPEVELQGICDLTWQNRKCSGNSLRIGRKHILYHGTVLYAADLNALSSCLSEAPRQPNYREGRDHRQFVTNIPLDAQQLRRDIESKFEVVNEMSDQVFCDAILPRMNELRSQRYDNPSWHHRH